MATTIVDIIPTGVEGVDVRSLSELLDYIAAYAGAPGDAVHFKVHGGASATIEDVVVAWSAPGTVIIEFLDGINERFLTGAELTASSHVIHRAAFCGPVLDIRSWRNAPGPAESGLNGKLDIVADASLAVASVSATVDRVVGMSGAIVFEAVGRVGQPASLTAVLTNSIQSDGPIEINLDATLADASLALDVVHCSMGGSDSNVRINRTAGANAATLATQWFNNIFVVTDLSALATTPGSVFGFANFQELEESADLDYSAATIFGAGNTNVLRPDETSIPGDSALVVDARHSVEDFRLLPNSHARGAGTDLGVATDIRGNARPSPPSAGATETVVLTGGGGRKRLGIGIGIGL